MRREQATRWLVPGLAAVLALPLLVAAIALRRPTWFPVLDLAMTELRVRDVGTSHTPLIGLPGRIGSSLDEQGSHPGPLSFYALAVPYRLLGSSAWALQAGVVVLDVVALSVSLWLARRRGGPALAVATAVLLALLTAGYGASTLTEPWNPYLPVLWWIVLLLASWSVLAGDLPALPVAVVAASFAAQTHVPYLGLAGGLAVLVAASLGWRAWRARPPTDDRRRLLRWTVASAALAAVLWAPPVLDQAVHDPGNARVILDHLGTPPEPPVGLRRGAELALLHLDVGSFADGYGAATGSLVDASSDPDGSLVPGTVTLAVWLLAAGWTVIHRHAQASLLRLHVVVGVALALGVVSMSRIFGKVWYYLMLWAWGTAGLLLLAVGLTAVAAVGPRLDAGAQRRARRIAGAAATVVLAVSTVGFTASAADAPPPAENLSTTLGRLLPATVAALEAGDGAAVGPDGRYLVRWEDAFFFGSQGFGLVSELERAGLDAFAEPIWHVPITDHRVLDPTQADAVVVLATGIRVAPWRQVPEAIEVATVEPRSPAERATFDRLRGQVVDELIAAGLDDLVPVVDGNLFGASIDPRVSRRAQRSMAEMLELGQETAVFIAPVGTAP